MCTVIHVPLESYVPLILFPFGRIKTNLPPMMSVGMLDFAVMLTVLLLVVTGVTLM